MESTRNPWPVVVLALSNARNLVRVALIFGTTSIIVELGFGGSHLQITAAVFGIMLVIAIGNWVELHFNPYSVRGILRSVQVGGLSIAIAVGWLGWDCLLISNDQDRYARFAPELITTGSVIFAVCWLIYIRKCDDRFRVAFAEMTRPDHGPAERAEALHRLLNGDQQANVKSRIASWGILATIAGTSAAQVAGHSVASPFFFMLFTMALCPGFLGALAGFQVLEHRYLPRQVKE